MANITGGADDDTLEGGDGIDFLYGGEVDDTLTGGADAGISRRE